MNTTIFCCAVGMSVPELIENIPEEWYKVYNDRYMYVYRNNTADAVALFACDDDGVIRTCDVKRKKNGKYRSIFLYSGLFDNIDSYISIKNDHDITVKIEKIHGKIFPICTQLDKKLALRRFYNKVAEKPVYDSVPIRNNEKQWRTVSDSAGDTCTDFIIIPDIWEDLWGTDSEEDIYKEIEDFVYSTVGYESCYEFPTGKMITLGWSFKRIPAGVAVIHRRGIDW